MDSWHLSFPADGRVALLPDEPLRRQALHRLAAVVRDRALLFCLVDDHVHLVARGERAEGGRLARAALLSLRTLAPRLEPAHIRPVDGRSHLLHLVRYCLLQPQHHGLAGHPALYTGSCFLDLVGARRLPGLRLPLSEALPRLRGRELLAIVGLTEERLLPIDDELLRGLGLTRLVEAAAATLAVGPVLAGKQPAVVAARAAVIALSTARTTELAWALGISTESVRQHRARPVEPKLLRAVRMRLAVEQRVAEAAGLVGEEEEAYRVGTPPRAGEGQ